MCVAGVSLEVSTRFLGPFCVPESYWTNPDLVGEICSIFVLKKYVMLNLSSRKCSEQANVNIFKCLECM